MKDDCPICCCPKRWHNNTSGGPEAHGGPCRGCECRGTEYAQLQEPK